MRKRNTTLRGQAREVIYNVHKFMQNEAAVGVHNLTQVQKRAAEATGTSVNTVKRILKEAKQSSSPTQFRTPGKKRPRKKPITDIDNFDLGVIKRSIHNFHIINDEFPSMSKLRLKLRSDINFQGSARSLSRIIRKQGFQWYRIEDNRRVLIEEHDIRVKRINYLEKLNYFRQQGRPIIHTYESYIFATHFKTKSDSLLSVKKSVSKEPRIFLVHAGSDSGFIPNALLMYESKSKTSKMGDTQYDMNFVTYEKWLRTRLLPNLPPNSVVVVGNASYQNKQYESAPNSDSKRSVMEAWLKEKKIKYNPNMLKPQLYHLIKQNKERDKQYSVDKLLAEHGHDVLRLPPYHPDLNPVEIAWATVKGSVNREVTEWNSANVMKLIQEKVNDMELKFDWSMLRDQLQEIESSYAKSDIIIDQMTEQYLVIGDGDANSGSGSDSNSDSDSGSDTDCSTSSPDEDLVPQFKRVRSDHTYFALPSTSNDRQSDLLQDPIKIESDLVQNPIKIETDLMQNPIKTETDSDSVLYYTNLISSETQPGDELDSKIKIETDSN